MLAMSVIARLSEVFRDKNIVALIANITVSYSVIWSYSYVAAAASDILFERRISSAITQ